MEQSNSNQENLSSLDNSNNIEKSNNIQELINIIIEQNKSLIRNNLQLLFMYIDKTIDISNDIYDKNKLLITKLKK